MHEESKQVNSAPCFSLLNNFALIEITGQDSSEFLHGQFITNIKDLVEGQCQYTAWCNPKGQVITNMLIINMGTNYLLLFLKDQKDYLLKRLQMFILRADVQVNDITDSHSVLGLKNIENFDKYKHAQCHALPHVDNAHIAIASTEIMQKLIEELKETATSVDQTAWNQTFIKSGIPWISETNRERFLPQMLNMDKYDALSYQKGCYPGQEVIARLHYRGEVKRRLYLIQSDSELNEAMLIKTANGENAGTIINATLNINHEYIALAVIDLDKHDQSLFPENNQGKAVSTLPLPYPVN